MLENEVFEEKFHEGTKVRRSKLHPKLWCSEDGNIAGTRKSWLKPQKLNKHGHLSVAYYRENHHRKDVYVHQLIGECWVLNPDPENNIVIDHKDNNPANNKASNIRWVTVRVNMQNLKDKKNGRFSSKYIGVTLEYTTMNGTNRYGASVTNKRVRKYLGYYDTEVEAALEYDLALIGMGLKPVNFCKNESN